MKAAAIDRPGPPSVLKPHELPVPEPSPNEVLIALRAAGIGVWDVDIRWHRRARAHARLENGGVIGRIVLRIGR